MFDPYYKWLGIRPEHQPPDHYRLLGLEAFESDADVIQSAAERQMAHIQSYKIGPQSDLSQRVLNEIAKAKVCLCNPSSKADYDRALRERLKTSAQRQAAPAPGPPPVVSVEVMPEVVRLRSDSRPVRRRRNRNSGIAILLGSLGIALVAILALLAVGRKTPRETPKTTPENDVVAKQQPQVPSAPSAQIEISKPTIAQPKTNVIAKPSVLPARTPERPQAVAAMPIPSAPTGSTPQPAARDRVNRLPVPSVEKREYVRSTISVVSESLDLPDFGNTQPIALPIRDNTSFVDIIGPTRGVLGFSTEASPDGTSWIVKSNDETIASITKSKTTENELLFSWKETIPEDAQFLRNAILIVHGSSKPVAISLRRTIEIDSPRLDLSKDAFAVPLEVPLWGLAPRTLELEAIALHSAIVKTRFPEDGCASHGSPARLVIRDELPKAGVELTLNGIGPVVVRTKPIFEDFDNKINPWTSARMKSLAAVYIRKANDCNRLIPMLKASIPAMQADMAALKRAHNPNLPNGPFILDQMNRLAPRIESAQNELAELQRTLPIIESQQRSYKELFSLSQDVHQQAKLEFRVFITVGKCTVDILHARPERSMAQLPDSESKLFAQSP